MAYSHLSHLSLFVVFFFSSRRRHTRFKCDWSSDVCSSDLKAAASITEPVIAWRMTPLPRLAIGTPPSCDRIRSTLERIAIDRNHKCKVGQRRVHRNQLLPISTHF